MRCRRRSRGCARSRPAEDDALTVLNACDPANLYGGELDLVPMPAEARKGGDTPPVAEALARFARVPSTHCVLWRGRPVLVAEDNGMRLAAAADVKPEVVSRALAAYLNRPNAPRRTTVEQWNDAAVLGSDGEPLLKALGFSRTPSGMERWTDRR